MLIFIIKWIMSLPVTLRAKIGVLLDTNTDESVQLICRELLNRLPKEALRGQPCPNCGFKIGGRTCICRNCSFKLKDPKPYGTRVPVRDHALPPEPPPCHENDCKCCGNNVGLNEGYKLSCGHVYHRSCLSEWRKTSSSCVDCRHIKIPADLSVFSI